MAAFYSEGVKKSLEDSRDAIKIDRRYGCEIDPTSILPLFIV